MKILLWALILISLIPNVSQETNCKCKQAKSDETTRRGGNEWLVQKEDGGRQKVYGKVESVSPEALDDVMVELFDKPEYLLCEWKEVHRHQCSTTPPANQRRIAACITGKDGDFCFENIPAGKYEMRISKGSAWNVTHVYLIVSADKSNRKEKPIEVSLRVGT